MALASDVISTATLRDSLGLPGDESDALIESYRDAAIDYIERYTNRCIIDRNGWVSDSQDFQVAPSWAPDMLIFSVTDVKAGSLILSYAPQTSAATGQAGSNMTIQTSDPRVNLTQDRVIIYAGEGADGWASVMRFSHPIPTLTADRGMAASDIPAPFGVVCSLIVRLIYDGSGFDAIASNSPIQLLLRPFHVELSGLTAR